MRYDGIIFDYGNTLVSYWTRDEWPGMLQCALAAVADDLRGFGLKLPEVEIVAARTQTERGDGMDLVVRPLEGRLRRIFDLDESWDVRMPRLCRSFLAPLFAQASVPDDVLPALKRLRADGLRLGILSNLPWGSPWQPWHEEIARHGLTATVDAVATCREAGYRKPDVRAFELVLSRLDLPPERCLFVGDDPRWDVAGGRDAGMDVALIDRHGEWPTDDCPVVHALTDVEALLDAE
jgi:putative hydrolase of the HAD superfamily